MDIISEKEFLEEYEAVQTSYADYLKRLHSLLGTASLHKYVLIKEEHKKYHKYFDRIVFTIFNQLDLVVGLKHLHYHFSTKSGLEQKYFSRVVSLTCWQILDDVNNILGREAAEFIHKEMGKQSLDDVTKLIDELKKIKKINFEKLKEIRNNTIAHKDMSAMDVINLVNGIDANIIYGLGISIREIQGNLIDIFILLLKNE